MDELDITFLSVCKSRDIPYIFVQEVLHVMFFKGKLESQKQ